MTPVQMAALIQDQKRRLDAQTWKIKELKTLVSLDRHDTPEEVACFKAQLRSWEMTYEGGTSNLPDPPADLQAAVVVPPTEMWSKFIAHLHETQPLEKSGTVKHQSFLGSISSYRRMFLDANK